MKKILLTIFSFCLLGFASNQLMAQPKVVAYVPNWIDLTAFSKTIDYAKITHINIAFENPTNSAGDLSYNSTNTTLITAAHAKNVKIFVSLGGGSASSDATIQANYFTLIKSANRAAFVQKILNYLVAHNLDGVDIDLEGPAINGDYGGFITELTTKLQPQGKLVTAALSKGYGGDKVLSATLKQFDWVNMMSYDATGSWDPNNAGQHSPYSLAVDDFTYFTGRGLLPAKAMVGLPFYGYGFGADFGDYNYNDILTKYPGAENYDQIGNTIYYNGIATIKKKTAYAIQNAGGVMIWELSNDVSGSKSLLLAIDQVIHPTVVVQSPYSGTASPIPGKIEAENYDKGGALVAYFDTDAGNTPNQYRTDDVDIETCTDDGGGYSMGYIAASEWVEYTVNVAQTGNYIVDFRVAALNAGGTLQIKNGTSVLGEIAIAATGGWTTWKTVTDTISLTAGVQILQLYAQTGGFNINSINFMKLTPTLLNDNAVMQVDVYPNPSTTELKISTPENIINDLELYDSLGRLLISKNANSNFETINIDNIKAGIYFLKVYADGKMMRMVKIVKL